MSNNYYLIPKAEYLEKLAEVKKELAPFIVAFDKIHLGQSAAGWVFICDHNDWQHFHDQASFREFTKNGQIVDEYDRQISFDEFWIMATNRNNAQRPRGFFKAGLWFHKTTGLC